MFFLLLSVITTETAFTNAISKGFIDNTICYLKPDEDWSSNYSSYDVGLMIKSWIFAYVRWKQKGIWGWREHEEPQPEPI